MKKEQVVIIGAGGHAKVTMDCIDRNKYDIAGIIDKDESRMGEMIMGVPILGSDLKLPELYHSGIYNAVLGLGHLGNYELRYKLYEQLKMTGFSMVNAVHEKAVISSWAKIGEGNVILPGAIINAEACIGDNNIINSGSVIEHDTQLGNNIHVAPGCVICGGCVIGDNTFIGAGSTVIQGIHIGHNVVIGAGSVIRHDIKDNAMVAQINKIKGFRER